MSDKIKVLLAEDGVGWLTLLRNALDDDGFEVICVEDKQGVLDRWMDADVLVIDVMLGEPQQDALGIVAVGELLHERGLGPEVPLIFVSSLGEHDDLPETKLHEFKIPTDRYVWLQKLFEEEELIRNIREELEQRTAAQSS